MNSAIFSRSGGYMGVGFAIPSNLARAMAEQLVSGGKVQRGYIGLAVQPLTSDIAEALGQKDSRGVLVNHVNENSPAERAGIRPGDVLVSLDGAPLADGGQYRNRAAQAKPGSPGEFAAPLGEANGSVLLRILDNGASRYVTLRWR